MEIRTVGQSLLPTVYRSIARQSTFRYTSPITRSLLNTRSYSATPARYQEDKPSGNDASTPPKPAPAKVSDYSSLIDQALDFTKTSPNASQGRTSHYESSRLPAAQKSKSSIDDLSASFASRSPNPNNRSSSGFDMAAMLDPMSRTALRGPSAAGPQPLIMPTPLPAYGPSVGRTVEVNPAANMDVGRAFRSLDINIARNRVRNDVFKQRFHERGGLKRKRLRSERWRRRFKEGFRGVVKMVSDMRKQGW